MTSFPKYDRYKDSGVEWLGEVPEHWELVRAKRIFQNVAEKGFPNEPLLSATQDKGVIPRDLLEQRVVMPIGQLQAFKLVRRNDFVISLRSFQGGIEHSAYRGLVSPAYTVLRLSRSGVSPGFLRHLLKASTFISELNVSVTGIRQGKNIDFAEFAESFLPLPPKPEQDRIVAFLDRKTAEIDALIAKKQRQIELLDEQKAILIHRAVTHGLNPNAKLKPSGIEWIGEIPEGWETRQVRHLFDNLDNRRIPISSIDRGKMTERLYDYYGASGAIDKVDGYIFDEDLILIAEDGANLVMRNLPLAIHATGKYWVNNHAHILRPREGPIEYWLHALECCDFTTSITGSAQPKLTKDALASCFLPCPPVNEQHAVVDFLNQNREAEETLRATINAQIESLKTLRNTLIAHAVTGRIKV